jgi:hypothetical protein
MSVSLCQNGADILITLHKLLASLQTEKEIRFKYSNVMHDNKIKNGESHQ